MNEASKPEKANAVLATLILVAAVANLNLSVANVALPSIGDAFDAGQTSLNLVAVGYSLGLAATVLFLGALGDHHGRRMMLILGTALAIPASLLAGLAPSIDVLIVARILGGVAAGMAFPTTLALITVLWSGSERTKSIALWSAIGGATTVALGPILSGALLTDFDWGSVFLITVPIALVALLLAIRLIPAHVEEAPDPVDNLGGFFSVVMIATLVLALNFAAVPGAGKYALALFAVAAVSVAAFVVRQRRVENPLYDLDVAARPTFWVAAVAGVIVFGSLMGAVFVGQQYMQNVLGYSTLGAGAALLPAAVFMVLAAPRSAALIESKGARFTLLLGDFFILLAFLTMLLLWGESSPYWHLGLAFAFVGVGIGLAGTPAVHSLSGSVPAERAGMASGTADLQRDLGGAIMQSIMGAILTAGYATSISNQVSSAPQSSQVTNAMESELQKSFSSASEAAAQYPQYKDQIIEGAKQAFLQGDHWAYAAGIIAILVGSFLVFHFFPKRDEEQRLMAGYAADDPSAQSAST